MKKKTRDVTFRKGRVYFKGKTGKKVAWICQRLGMTPQEWFDKIFMPPIKATIKVYENEKFPH